MRKNGARLIPVFVLFLFFLLLLLSSCGKTTDTSSINGISDNDNKINEIRFIRWEDAYSVLYDEGGAFIPAKITCMVPALHPADGLEGIPLAEALKMNLVPLDELAPPFTAVKVDGCYADDPRYPLVRAEGPYYKQNRGGSFIEREARRLFDESPRAGLPEFYTIAAGGDAMMARGAQELLFEKGPAEVFGGTAPFLENSNLALLNLEGVISDRTGAVARKTYVFRFSPLLPQALRSAGVDAVLAANNHVMDYGEQAFLDSIDHLRAAGIFPLGGGRTIGEASSFFEADPANTLQMYGTIRVYGIASFPPERSGFDGASAAAADGRAGMLFANGEGEAALIQKLRKDDHDGLDIVLFHGGTEYSQAPDSAARSLYTRLAEAGADLLLGSHPHVEQGFEWIGGTAVFWSLGDYVFADMEDTPGGDKGLFVVLRYRSNRLVYIDLYPLKMTGPRTVLAPKEQLDRFYSLTRQLRREHVQL
jgi:poly-gamma-glutamate synthesis protein (capsule biosynthesis protein)